MTPPRDPASIAILVEALAESHMDIGHALRVLFNSDFFKEARFRTLKSPAEVIIGTLRLVGGSEFPGPELGNLSLQAGYMGQELLNPPSVESWHSGVEWINSGSLMRRTNSLADTVGDLTHPGVRYIVERLNERGVVGPEEFVDKCLDLMGPVEVDEATRRELVSNAMEGDELRWNGRQTAEASSGRVAEMLQLIVSLRAYQSA